MTRIKVDLCVIGAGSGGLSVAAGAVQMGASVVLVEGHKMGGDCLNYGCVPSKAILAAAKAAHAANAGAAFGVSAQVSVDYAAAMEHVARTIATIEPNDSEDRIARLGVTVIRAYARFLSPSEVEAADTTVTARRFVIATGSRPFVPNIPGLDTVPYLTNETIFDLRARPDHLMIIGGGPIGIEMAQAHRRLGCAVTVIEAASALGREDPELSAIAIAALRSEGVEILEHATASAVRGESGAITVVLKDGREVNGSHLLVAIGRRANIERLSLPAAGIDTESGLVRVNAHLRTTNRRVYAVGDVATHQQFTHVAGYHAGIVIREAMLGLPAKVRTDHIPRATYTDPELAQVGPTEAEARALYGDRLQVVRFPFAESDRAIAEGRTQGLIKVMVLRGRPIGVGIVGTQAGEMIGLWALAIANRLRMTAIAATVLPYPTFGEISKRAAGAYFSPKLFDSSMVKRIVRWVQRILP